MNGIKLYVGNDINNRNIILNGTALDLDGNENIEITLKQTDIRDLSANYADYTKKFTIPASRVNKRALKYWNDVKNDDQWPNDVEIPARIDVDGILFRMGVLKIDNANFDDNGNLKNFTVQFYSNLKSLKDLYGDKLIGALDYTTTLLTNTEFEYSDSKIMNMFHSSNNTGIEMPLVSVKRIWNDFQTLKYTNGSTNANGIKKEELRPALRCRQIISTIEKEYGIKFIGDILDNQSSPLNKLHIWLNKNEEAYSNAGQILDLSGTPTISSPNWGSSNLDCYFDIGRNLIKLTKRNFGAYINMKFRLNVRSIPNNNTPYKIFLQQIILNTDLTVNEPATSNQENNGFVGGTLEWVSGTQDNAANYVWNLQSNEPNLTTKYFRIIGESQGGITFTDLDITVQHYLLSNANFTSNTVVHRLQSPVDNTLVARFNVPKSLPDLSVADFMSSLMKLFNLVVIPIYDPFLASQYGTQNIYKLEYFNVYYGSTNTLDITKYTKLGKKINKIPTFKKIEFKHADSQFGTNIDYKNAQLPAREYGSTLQEFPNGTNEFKVETKFGLLIWHELANVQFSGNPLDNQYWITADALNEDYTKGVFNKPIVFFKSGLVAPIDQRYLSYVNSNGTDQPVYRFNAMTNIDNLLNYTTTLTFSEENMFGNGVYANTLYANYYKNLVSGVYSSYAREFEIEAVLPKNIYTNLSLGTTLIIQDARYSITDITLNLITGQCKLKLNNIVEESNIVEDTSANAQRLVPPPEIFSASRYGNNIKISWDGQSEEKGIFGYQIDFKVDEKEYEKLAFIRTNEPFGEYVHEGIDEKQIYTYKITVQDFYKNDGMPLAIEVRI
ncbi:hypothetical protein ACFPVY_04025 [Flavobacterium qiangtangense]|uniref:Fibronectin type-III domain-containing protein n=1 Tax=Flavobacterium qiangtangense TaxID=1442595 RepID=A0ABW1PKT3_9FLAO